MQRPAAALRRQKPTVHQGVWMVARENNWPVLGDIVEIDNINTSKKRIGDDTNKPIDKALKHAIDLELPERPTVRIEAGAVNAGQLL